MEFSFKASQLLGCDYEGLAIIDGNFPQKYRKSSGYQGINAHRTSSFFNQNTSNASPDE